MGKLGLAPHYLECQRECIPSPHRDYKRQMRKGPLSKAGTAHHSLTKEKPQVQLNTANLYLSDSEGWEVRQWQNPDTARMSKPAPTESKGSWWWALLPGGWGRLVDWADRLQFTQCRAWPKTWTLNLEAGSLNWHPAHGCSPRGAGLPRDGLTSLHMMQKWEWIAEH